MALPSGSPSAPRFWSEPRGQLVRRVVHNRLPTESVLVDAWWKPGSPLGSLAASYPTVACLGPDAEERPGGDRWAGPAVRSEIVHLPLADGSVDGVLVVDVIAAVEDDRAVLAEAQRVLRTGGLVLVTAPCGPHLWSGHDERVGHRRRYTGEDLVALVASAGLLPEQLHYFQCLLHPLFVASRRLARRRPAALAWEQRPSPLLARVLTAVNRAEVTTGRRVRWPRGSSLVAVGRKP